MKKELSVKERVALLAMLVGRTPEERLPKLSESGLTRKEWEALPDLVELVDGAGQPAPPPPKKKAPLFVRPADEAWAWANEYLAGPVVAVRPLKRSAPQPPPKTSSNEKPKARPVNAALVLENLLAHLEEYFESQGETLATFLGKSSARSEGDAGEAQRDPGQTINSTTKSSSRGADERASSSRGEQGGVSAELAARIREESLDLAGGVKRRVRLQDLRKRLPDVGREELDRALLTLQSNQRLVLYRLDNPAEITRADEEAALFVAGNPRHIIYLEA